VTGNSRMLGGAGVGVWV